MRGRVLYVGLDPDLPAFLSAYGTGGFSVSSVAPTGYRGEAADLLIWDTDAAPLSAAIPAGTRIVTVGYRGDADLVRPFLFSDFETVLDPEKKKETVVLSSSGRELFCGDVRIRLSPLAYDLFRALRDAAGAIVPTAALCRIGGRELSPHALGAAICALRRKLERLPVFLRIRSERGEGYRLIPPD